MSQKCDRIKKAESLKGDIIIHILLFGCMKLSNEVRGKIEEEFMYGESDHSLEGSCVDDDLDMLRECIRHIRCVLTGEDWED